MTNEQIAIEILRKMIEKEPVYEGQSDLFCMYCHGYIFLDDCGNFAGHESNCLWLHAKAIITMIEATK